MKQDKVRVILISLKLLASSQACSHNHGSSNEKADKVEELKNEFLDIASFLEAQFGDVELNEDDNKITINMDGVTAVVDTMKFVSDMVYI